MNRRDIKTNLPLIYSLLKGKDNDIRNVLISNLNDQAFDFVCNCVNKVIYEPHKLRLSTKQLKKLRSQLAADKSKLIYLAKKKGNRKRKKKVVATQTGAGLGIALAHIIPMLVSGISSLIK